MLCCCIHHQDADLLLLQLVAAAEDAGVDVRMLNVPGLSGLLGSRAFRDTMEYEEFKLPDINNDDLITRQEVMTPLSNTFFSYKLDRLDGYFLPSELISFSY